jgi:hypothetical protein
MLMYEICMITTVIHGYFRVILYKKIKAAQTTFGSNCLNFANFEG